MVNSDLSAMACYAGGAKQLRANMAGSPESMELPAALDHGSEAWQQAAGKFDGLAIKISDALRAAESAHEGRAADAANSSINEIVPHAEAASQTATGVASALGKQAESQISTFRDIPSEGETLSNGRPVQLDPPEKGWVDDYDDTWYLGWASDYEERQEDFQLTNDRASEVQERYQRETEANLAAVPEFQPMPGEPANATPVGATTPSARDAMGSSQFSSLSSGGGAPAGSSSSWASSPASGGGAPSLGGGSGAGAPPAGSGSAWAPSPPSGGLPPGVVRGPDGTLYRQNPKTGAWERQNPHNGRWAQSPNGGPGGAAGGRGGVGAGGSAGGRAGGLGAGAGAGAGGRAGVGGLGGGPGGGASAAGGAGSAGGRGGAGAPGGGMGGGQRGGQQGDDPEHERPSWLIEEDDVFTNDMRAVAPPVFGDWENQDR